MTIAPAEREKISACFVVVAFSRLTEIPALSFLRWKLTRLTHGRPAQPASLVVVVSDSDVSDAS
jgi:hypothetical protein